MQCDHGKATINLQLNLQQYPPPSFKPYPPPPRQHPQPYHQPSPSRLRRSARRAQTRVQNEKVFKTGKEDLFSPNNDANSRSDATEQVVASNYSKIKAEKPANCDMKDKSEKNQDDAKDFHELAEQAFPFIDQPKNEQNSENIDKKFENQNAEADDERAKIMYFMEDLKNSLTQGLRQTVQQSVQQGVQ